MPVGLGSVFGWLFSIKSLKIVTDWKEKKNEIDVVSYTRTAQHCKNYIKDEAKYSIESISFLSTINAKMIAADSHKQMNECFNVGVMQVQRQRRKSK